MMNLGMDARLQSTHFRKRVMNVYIIKHLVGRKIDQANKQQLDHNKKIVRES